MPELPEVETVRRGVEPYVVGRTITQVIVRDPRLRWPIPAHFAEFAQGQQISHTTRRGKYLLLHCVSGDAILIHLGMSGRLLVRAHDYALAKHDHLDLVLDGAQRLRYHDPRRFGAVLPWSRTEATHPLLQHLGPEPFTDAFNGAYLAERAHSKNQAVKTFLMDAEVVVGAGNIYAAESLFRAGIRPDIPAKQVAPAAYERLATAVKAILQAAVVQGGTTLKDFAGANGESGYFQQQLFVYGREGQPCRVCGTAIAGLRLANRQSCFCPSCQTNGNS